MYFGSDYYKLKEETNEEVREMFGETIKLWEEEEYTYPLACGFIPNLVSYIHEERN